MKLLAFDTTLGACSAAVWVDGEVVAASFRLLQQGHAEALMPLLQAVCADAQLALGDLGALAVTVGPGTFTGVRIGLAAARGLRLALRGPVVPIPTLRAVAATARRGSDDHRPVLAVHDARRDEVYVQPFGPDLHALAEPALQPVAAVLAGWGGRDVVLAGTAAPLLAVRWPSPVPILGDPAAPSLGQPDARDFAGLAAADLAAGGAAAFADPPLPVYLRAPDAKLPVPRAP